MSRESASTVETASRTGASNALRRRLLAGAGAHPVFTIFALALLLRTAVALGIYALWEGRVFGDEGVYWEMAVAVAEGRVGTWDEYTRWLYLNTATWTLPLTALTWLGADRIVFGQLLASIAGAATAASTAWLGREAAGNRAGMWAGCLVAVFPSQILWSSLTLKDAAVWCSAATLGVAVARMRDGSAARWTAAAISLLVAIAFLRTHTFVVCIWATGLAVALGPRLSWSRRAVTASLIVGVLPWVLGLGPGGFTFASAQTDTLAERRIANAAGASTAIDGLSEVPKPPASGPAGTEVESARGSSADEAAHDDSRTGTGVPDPASSGAGSSPEAGARGLGYLPRGLVTMLFEPLPGTVAGHPRLLLAALENLVWHPVLLLALAGLSTVWASRRVAAYPALMAAGMAVVYSLTEGNFGTAYRHRGELVWATCLLAALGIDRLRRAVAQRQRSETCEP